MASINKRKGIITGTDAVEDYATVYCDVSLFLVFIFTINSLKEPFY